MSDRFSLTCPALPCVPCPASPSLRALPCVRVQIDAKVAAEAAGIDLRSCTTSEVQAHLDDFNLAQEFGTYGRIKGLSGGQKVKLVLAAAFWTVPHLLVLDEPTNYLDRESLGALAEAIKVVLRNRPSNQGGPK